jgi:hypothetical protein
MGMGTARLPKSPSHYYVTTYYVGTLTILLWTNNYPVLYLTEWNKRSGTLLLLHVPTYSPVLQHLRGKSASLLITRFTNATALHCTCCTADQILSPYAGEPRAKTCPAIPQQATHLIRRHRCTSVGLFHQITWVANELFASSGICM